MAVTISTIEILKNYLNGVLNRANHHAHNVNEISLAIVGGIIWRTTGDIKVLSRGGEMKNALWLEVNSDIFCFAYNHTTGDIEVREGSIQGKVIYTMNNSTPISDIKTFFENL